MLALPIPGKRLHLTTKSWGMSNHNQPECSNSRHDMPCCSMPKTAAYMEQPAVPLSNVLSLPKHQYTISHQYYIFHSDTNSSSRTPVQGYAGAHDPYYWMAGCENRVCSRHPRALAVVVFPSAPIPSVAYLELNLRHRA